VQVLCNELESGAITQILWNPDLLLVYHDFLEPSWGVQLDFVEPSTILPLATRMNFAYVQEKTQEHGAIALGVSFPLPCARTRVQAAGPCCGRVLQRRSCAALPCR
jgi:hypothetical protein